MSNKSNKKKKESQSSKHVSAVKREQQNRREFTGILLLLIAILAFLCCIPTDAFLLATGAGLIGGLFGQIGRYILPIVLIAIAITLFTSKDRPVKLRIFWGDGPVQLLLLFRGYPESYRDAPDTIVFIKMFS